MNARLILSIGSDQIRVDYVPAVNTSLWQRLLPKKRVASHTQALTPQAQHRWTHDLDQGMGPALEASWTAVTHVRGQSKHPIELRVELGQRYCHLGLLSIDVKVGIQASAIPQYLQAWVQQVWQQAPDSRILRWEWTVPGQTILVSSIERKVYDTLLAYAERHKLKFVSCMPALWHALEQATPPLTQASTSTTTDTAANVIVWTEHDQSGTRSPAVQLLKCQGKNIQAIWRGWLPPNTDDTSGSEALEGALRRFMLAHTLPSSASITHMRWAGLQANKSGTRN